MAEKFFNSKNFVKDLLIVDILSKTNYENPKNTKQILNEVETRLAKLFPNDSAEIKNDDKNNFTVTILRHVQDMNKSGLYDIRTHKQKKRGYYNAKIVADSTHFIFTPEEFSIIAMALYRTPKEETKKTLTKFKNLVNTANTPFYKFLQTHLKYCEELTRKTNIDILPTLREIFFAITNGKKIQFKLYDPISFSATNLPPKFQKIRQDLQSDAEISVARDKIYTASPYFPTFENDECYLVVYSPNREDEKYGFDNYRRLSHFRISLIGDLKVLDEDAVPLDEITDCARYICKHSRRKNI